MISKPVTGRGTNSWTTKNNKIISPCHIPSWYKLKLDVNCTHSMNCIFWTQTNAPRASKGKAYHHPSPPTDEGTSSAYWTFFDVGTEDANSLLDDLMMKRMVSTSIPPTNPKKPPAAFWKKHHKVHCMRYDLSRIRQTRLQLQRKTKLFGLFSPMYTRNYIAISTR